MINFNRYFFICWTLCFIPWVASAETQVGDWPLKMDSSHSFDVASKCEMLVFVEVFNTYDAYSTTSLLPKLKLKSINEASIDAWKTETKLRILNNFKKLSHESLAPVVNIQKPNTWEDVSKLKLSHQLPAKFSDWYEKTLLFYENYVNEQLRLAALYPKVTSEILTFSANETQGHDFEDKTFLLTFDDGPTQVNGNTDKLLKVLADYQLTGMFFVLGEQLEKRLQRSSKIALQQLYQQHKVYSHGKVHEPHQTYRWWKNSIDDTNALIHSVFEEDTQNKLLHFRPPYGQRNQDIVDYFSEHQAKIILWNIDSRDWSSKLNAQEVAHRQLKLMLLWRKGILLFHDIHSKAQTAIPLLHDYFKNSSITWLKPNDF